MTTTSSVYYTSTETKEQLVERLLISKAITFPQALLLMDVPVASPVVTINPVYPYPDSPYPGWLTSTNTWTDQQTQDA
jgi:hypothetical protein